MRPIHVADKLKIRFPSRDESFLEGVEIGILAGLMGLGEGEIVRRISSGAVEQARSLARKLGYRLSVTGTGEGWSEVTVTSVQVRPRLSVVR